MSEDKNISKYSYEETYRMDLKSYKVEDHLGREVEIQPKDPAVHESYHKWESHPTFFYNLGSILFDYDRVGPTTSKNPSALKHAETGEILVFEKDDYMVSLGVPFVATPIGDTVSVIVKYDEVKGRNYTLSYRIDKK